MTEPVHHKMLHNVVANDENGNTFAAQTIHPHPAAEEHVGVWVFIDGENGWQANIGQLSYQMLKKLPDGTFGA
jgi:hypothetical protein